jgi:hypothetical protein
MLELPLQSRKGVRVIEAQAIPIRANEELLTRAQQRPTRNQFQLSCRTRPFDGYSSGNAPQPHSKLAVIRSELAARQRRRGTARVIARRTGHQANAAVGGRGQGCLQRKAGDHGPL